MTPVVDVVAVEYRLCSEQGVVPGPARVAASYSHRDVAESRKVLHGKPPVRWRRRSLLAQNRQRAFRRYGGSGLPTSALTAQVEPVLPTRSSGGADGGVEPTAEQ